MEKKNQDGNSPLHIACIEGNLEFVKNTLEHCDNIREMKNNRGQYPWHIACENGFEEIIALFLVKDPNFVMRSLFCGSNILHMACENGYIDIVRLLLKNLQVFQKNQKTRKNHSNLEELEEGVIFYIEEGDDIWNETPLHRACSSGHLMIVKLLLDQFINHDSKMNYLLRREDYSNSNALHLACMRGHPEIVKFLLEQFPQSINYLEQGNEEGNPLLICSTRGSLEIVEIILDFLKDPKIIKNFLIESVEDRDDKNALHLAAQAGHINVVKLLLEQFRKGPERENFIKRCTDTDENALHLAAQAGHVNVVKLLLEQFSNSLKSRRYIEKVNIFGYNALDLAILTGNYEVRKILLQITSKRNKFLIYLLIVRFKKKIYEFFDLIF